jgi:hypothetical protein
VGLDFELGFMLAKQAGALPLELHYQSAYIYFLNKRHLFLKKKEGGGDKRK